MRVIGQLVAVVAIAAIGGQAAMATEDGSPWLTLVVGLLSAALAVAVYAWVVGRTERRPVTEVGRKGALSSLGLGTLLGIAVFGVVIANVAFLGYFDVEGTGSGSEAAGLVGFMAAAAATEELLFRGVLFRLIEERTGTWIALVVTAALFGLYHMANPDATLWGAAAIMIEAGGMLTAAYIATRRLWVPIGLHFGWNFAAAGIFSTVVSGNGSNDGLLDTTMSGPTLVTGGDFGPEASLYSVFCCSVVAVVFLWVAHRRGNLRPRRGRTARTAVAPTLVR